MQQLTRDIVGRKLRGSQGVGVGIVRHNDHGVVPERQLSRRHHQPFDRVPVVIGVLVDRDRRLGRPRLGHELVAGIGTRANLHRGGSWTANVVLELAADP